MVLLAVVRLGDEAYGVPISKELLILANREVSVGSIYAALERLENKGFVSSSLGEPTPERGGRAKRFYRLEAPGERALQDSAVTAKRIWDVITEVWGKEWAKEWGKRWGKEAGR